MLQPKKIDIDIEEYYTCYGPMVLRRCRQLLRDEDRALDAMQDVFTNVLMKKESLKDTYPSSLLFQIAFSDDSEDRIMITNTLNRIFNKEKTSTREIAVLHFVDGMTLKEVATEVGLSLSGVRKRIRNLRTRIQFEKEVRYEN